MNYKLKRFLKKSWRGQAFGVGGALVGLTTPWMGLVSGVGHKSLWWDE